MSAAWDFLKFVATVTLLFAVCAAIALAMLVTVVSALIAHPLIIGLPVAFVGLVGFLFAAMMWEAGA